MFFKIQLSGKVLAVALLLVATINTSSFAGLKAKLGATKADVTAFFGTSNVKVVFINGDSLYYVDYSEPTPAIKYIAKASQKPKIPVISPDGKYVTYATKEDVDGAVPNHKSTAYICSLTASATPYAFATDTGCSPRFVQNASNLTVIFATSNLVTNNTPIYSIGRTVKKTITPGAGVGAYTEGTTQVVAAIGSYFGGLSYDGSYLVGGYVGGPDAWMYNTQTQVRTNASLYHLKIAATGRDTMFDNGNACNISVSSSRVFTNAMMFFDFGKANGLLSTFSSPVLPASWTAHQNIYIQRYDSEMLKIYRAPATPGAGATEWQNPEWSNHPYYGAASLFVTRFNEVVQDNNKLCEKVMAINLKDSVYLNLVQASDTADMFPTTNMLYPWIWVDPTGLTESTTWLARPYAGVINRAGAHRGNAKISFDNFTLRSNISIGRVTLFTALGDVIATMAPQKTALVSLDTWRNRFTGVYFVKAECVDGSSSVFRLISSAR